LSQKRNQKWLRFFVYWVGGLIFNYRDNRMAKRVEKTKDNEPYVLPASDKELERFISKYKIDMTQQVISSIEFAVTHNLPIIEVFQFKGSSFVVTLSNKEFDINLENIYNYYLETEQYELCKKVVELRNKLKSNLHEKTQKSNTT